MRMMIGLRSLVCLSVLVGSTMNAHARSLVKQVDGLFGAQGISLPTAVGHTAHFSSASASALGSLVGQLAGGAADFTPISTTPGFTYRFNPELDVYERAPGGMASIFVDVPQTVGKGRFDIGMSYLYVEFAELDGEDLDGLTIDLQHQDTPPIGQFPDPAFEAEDIDLVFDKFNLRSHVISTFSTYGITDRWDVNVLVPIVVTSLDVEARAVIKGGSGVHVFADGGIVQAARADDEKVGLGDILLRTKYRFTDNLGFNVGSGLVVRVPTGDKNDFQGFGDTTVTPFFVAAQSFGPHNLHVNVGIEIDPESLSRSRARYAAGASVQLVKRFAFLLDFIGSSGLTDEQVDVTVATFDSLGNQNGTQRQTTEFRTDIFDIAAGFKVNPIGTVVAFAGVIVPVNEEGLRPEIVPSGGVEVTF